MKNKHTIYIIIILVVIVLGYVSYSNYKKAGQYDDFAKCLTSKSVKMYGAYWCSHCADQKRIFGNSFQYVTYVECAIPGDDSAQTPICIQNKIQGYPTWEINGEKNSGVKDINTLSSLSGCQV